MFCSYCGKQNADDAIFCSYCGARIGTDQNQTNSQTYQSQQNYQQPAQQNFQSKGSIGVIMALFLGIIGLVIGLLMYPTGSYERDTFVKAWVKTYVIVIIASVVLCIGMFGCFACLGMMA